MTFGIFNTLLSVNRPNRNQYISTYKQYKFKTDSVYYGLYSKLNYNKTEMHAAKTLLHTTQHWIHKQQRQIYKSVLNSPH